MRAKPLHSNNLFSSFTKKYKLSKTLRFELVPEPKTEKYLKEFVELDTQRGKDYKELKKIVDEYHKNYIEKSLSVKNILKTEDLQKVQKFLLDLKKIRPYKEKEKINKELEKLQKKLRVQIVDHFKNKKELFGKELITKILPEWLDKASIEDAQQKKDVVKKFSKFTTYLTGFHENRKNIYSDKEQSTAVSYRIINENLPRFLSNIETFKKISKFPELPKDLEKLKREMKEEFSHFKIKNVKSLFETSFFNNCLTQKGIDNYNFIIGGKTLESGQKVKGLNEKINLFRQKKKKRNQIKISAINFPLMQTLHKQILSDKQSHSFYETEEFTTREEVLNSIDELWKAVFETKSDDKNLLQKIQTLFTNLSENEYELDKIYFRKNDLSKISNKLFKSYSIIPSALKYLAEQEISNKKNREKWIKKDFYSFKEIHTALSLYSKENKDIEKQDTLLPFEFESTLPFYFKYEFQSIPILFENSGSYRREKTEKLQPARYRTHTVNNTTRESLSFLSHIEKLYKNVKKISRASQYNELNKQEIATMQNLLKSLMDVLHLIKPVHLEKDKKKIENLEKDTSFYGDFESSYKKLSDLLLPVYNKSRNYIAQNKNRLKKIKINFEDCTLLDGWDVNKEKDNLSIILRKKEKNGKWLYYLGVINKENRNLFDYQINFRDHNKDMYKKQKNQLKKEILAEENTEVYYEKLNYKLLPDPSKMLPKVFFSKKNSFYFNPSREIERIKSKKTYAKNDGEDFNLKDCHKLIQFYKDSINKHYDWKKFKFKFSKTNNYKDISDFYHEVSSQGYKLSFDKIKTDYIEEKVKKGELYLFKIYSKDFSPSSEGKPNLHTSYFNLLFEEENLKDTVFKLNGKAEVFYRKSSKQRKISHKKNELIRNKNPENSEKTSTFDYDLIKDKRFTEDKYFFHVPLDLNFRQRGMKPYQFNQDVLKTLKSNKNINIIGIDRGERHLAYYTVINQHGQIQKQGSFNKIVSNYKSKNGTVVNVETNYHKLLEKKEKERDKSRKLWTEIENIKELKAGYLSHLVHNISHLMIKYNAVVVFEDLNKGFKRSRMKFEKQVYQKLEKALIDKLNYMVFKEKNYKNPGGFLNAYQLTAPFESFSKMGKQSGFIFYTPAYYTSKACPLTGFVNLIYHKYKNIEASKIFFKNFNEIYFDNKKDYFVFDYQDGVINSGRKTESNASWRVCTHGSDRYKYDKNTKSYEKICVTEKMKYLFNQYNIKYDNRQILKQNIVSQTEATFFKELIELLKLTVQLRYTNPKAKTSNEEDFILSPVADKTGRFFDSRTAKINEPKNADANGAYHIALKGLKTLKSIHLDKQIFKIDPIINKDWFQFIRSKTFSFRKKAS